MAASVLLLVGAGLLTRTLWHASQVRLGFDPNHTVVASTDFIRQGYEKNAAANLLDPLLDSLLAQPGVHSAALGPPPMSANMFTSVKLEGHDIGEGKKDGILGSRVSPGYFKTVGIPLLRGRDFAHSILQTHLGWQSSVNLPRKNTGRMKVLWASTLSKSGFMTRPLR